VGLLDSILGTAMSSLSGNQQPGLLNMAIGLIQSHPQGLQGLIDQFNQSGLAQHAQSWVGSGQNMPVSGEQLSQVLGSGKLQALAQQFGVPAGGASGGLAAILPQIIDHLTPNGQIPPAAEILQRLSALKNAA
jgi:uncharacterized protein YidB (DUF937 family)